MFGNLIQRLVRHHSETPCTMACEELNQLILYTIEGEYDLAIEFMIFESNFDPDKASCYTKKNSQGCRFDKLAELFNEYVNSRQAKAFFSDRINGEISLRDRVDKLTSYLKSINLEPVTT